MKSIELPAHAYEADLVDLLDTLSASDADEEIRFDFKLVTFWTPGALVALLVKTHSLLRLGKSVKFSNCESFPAFRYFQRINFFSLCGVELPEDFTRHQAGSRFVELQRIGGEGSASVEQLSTDVAYCLFPEVEIDDPEQSGLFDLIEYSVSELANNTIQHSKSHGFAMAQYAASKDLIRVAIADHGIGIRRSFAESFSPHWHSHLTDAEAIDLALLPQVSSKSHQTSAWGGTVNAGVGLTLLRQICLLTGGHFFVASGNSCILESNSSPLERGVLPNGFSGTVCAMSIVRGSLRNFPDLLHKAKHAARLLPTDGEFDRLFS